MELPDLGEYCTEETCKRLDFLPLKCDACQSIFCKDHISYKEHCCPNSYKKNAKVPACPLCNVVVPWKRSDIHDRETAIKRHMTETGCQSSYLKERRRIYTNKCSTKDCKIKELVPVLCSDCGKNYCFKHRHPGDHICMKKVSYLSGQFRRFFNYAEAERKKFFSYKCSISECEKTEIVPLKCVDCKKSFCLKHRSDHLCAEKSTNHRGSEQSGEIDAHNDLPLVENHAEDDSQSNPVRTHEELTKYKCSKGECDAEDVIPVRCTDCSKNFCLEHIHSDKHSCAAKDTHHPEKYIGRIFMLVFIGIIALGFARVMDLPTFRHQMDEDEYLLHTK